MVFFACNYISSFRPLAGINCNARTSSGLRSEPRFRPLAGINCNMFGVKARYKYARFRPLTGINCNPEIEVNIYNEKFPSPRGDKLQWQTLLTDHENLPQKAESCTFQQHYTSFYRKRKGLFEQRGGFRWCELVTEVRKKVCRTGWLALHLRRRSADGVEKISHKDHLDSAEGASKP